VRKYVPNFLGGKTVGMMSLTEPSGGSDPVGAMKTTAKRDRDVYRLNGSKMFATLANRCDVGVLLAKTDPQAGARGITAFIVEPKKYPGFEARPIQMLGLSKALDACAVFLDDFIVPVENRLGEEGEGFKIVMQALQAGRLNVAARAVGIAQACLDEAQRYLNERTVRGRAIGSFQMIQGDLADIVVNVEASRLLVYRTAAMMDAGQPSNRAASIAKYHASLTAKHAADKTQQFFGGYGLAQESRISWLNSYAYLYFNGEGSTNVQRVLIAEDALGYKKADRHAGTLRFRDPRRAPEPASM
jgi:alkylation response protein AidB-like acyl-CoA dehydrogenase